MPGRSVYGFARRDDTDGRRSLEGPVYYAISNKMPTWSPNCAVRFNVGTLVGRIDSDKKGGMRTTFENIPTTPLTRNSFMNGRAASKGCWGKARTSDAGHKKATACSRQNGSPRRGRCRSSAPCKKRPQHGEEEAATRWHQAVRSLMMREAVDTAALAFRVATARVGQRAPTPVTFGSPLRIVKRQVSGSSIRGSTARLELPVLDNPAVEGWTTGRAGSNSSIEAGAPTTAVGENLNGGGLLPGPWRPLEPGKIQSRLKANK